MNYSLTSWDANGSPVEISGQAAADIARGEEELALEQILIPTREQILTLETRMRQFEQIDCPLTHTFAPGSYARGIKLPTGALVVGKIHKHAHLNIVSRGLVTVVTEFGRVQIDARESPVTFTSDPGTKRALYVHEETYWTTIHLVQSTDLAEIERDIIARDFVELDAFMARECVQLIEQGSGPEVSSTSEGRVLASLGSQLPLESAEP